MNSLSTILSLILSILSVQTPEIDRFAVPSVDLLPPQIHAIDSCGGWSISIIVRDTAEGDMGLKSIVLLDDPAADVLVEFDTELVAGDTSASLRLSLREGVESAEIRLVAEDVAGNADTIPVRLERRLPVFIEPEISLFQVGRNEKRVYTLKITHASMSGPVLITRLRFRDGRHFSVSNLLPGGYVEMPVEPGDTARFDVRFMQGLAESYDDTLVVTVDCVDWEIPVHATTGTPLLAVNNLDFWQVLIGSEMCTGLSVYNPGTDTVYISAIEVGGGEYRFDTAAIPFLPDRVAPGDTIVVPICFLPRRLGLLLGTVTFISSAADTVSVVARLVGIGVNSFASSGFDDEGRELQITVVPQQRFLTVVSGNRSLNLDDFRLYNLRGQEVEVSAVELIGDGWWQIRMAGRLNVGMYYLRAFGTDSPPLSVKFVVLE